MKLIFQFWCFWLLPHKFYGGGGGNDIQNKTDPQAETLASIANKKWRLYEQKYVPVENQWIAKVGSLNNPIYHNQATGQASAGVKDLYGPQTGNVGASMRGNRLGQGEYISQAKDVAQATGKANSGATNRYMQATENVINVGNGQSTQAINGLGDVARESVQGQIAQAKNANDLYQAGLGSVGAVAGGLTAGAAHYADKKGWGLS